MKKLILVLAVGIGACQQSAPPVAKAPTKFIPDPSAKVISPNSLRPKFAKLTPADSLTPEMLALLKQFNLAPLWQGQRTEYSSPVLDGFYGEEYRRISFVFTEIRRDSINPGLFHVSGKNKFQKTVTAFKGTLQVKKLADLQDHGFLDSQGIINVYTAKASFKFQEESGSTKSGEITGTAFLDFFINNENELQLAETVNSPDTTAPARGAGVIYRGTWSSYTSHTQKPFIISNKVTMIAPELLPNFTIGERGETINPKYAKLGWNDLMENEEWWAEPGKPSLNL